MVNMEDFIKRLEAILEYYSISASVFADKLGVQRSGLSHLLSGRNKPSLDFVMKITESFPEVDLYWLLNGTGSFPGKEDTDISPQKPETPLPPLLPEKEETVIGDLFSQPEEAAVPKPKKDGQKSSGDSGEKKTERIVIFYSDGTFKEYIPE